MTKDKNNIFNTSTHHQSLIPWCFIFVYRRQMLSPYCNTLRSNPLQLTCRQDQRAVAVCNLQKFPKPLPQEYQYFDELSGVPAEDLPYYGGSVEIADYCPFSQEFSWHLSGEYQRSSDCRVLENQPGFKDFIPLSIS
ncbi:hypothetical protein J1605_008237 [Eschrichtius robustus]|uniref:Leishmanolysin-like peptidase n=1 Tax=Eschrichtius robustus TaxID=9764 RepID=A0AB34GYT1_ESCRO|nr:hypothetical protein J1605_008237 [Eschrichtius robustus]